MIIKHHAVLFIIFFFSSLLMASETHNPNPTTEPTPLQSLSLTEAVTIAMNSHPLLRQGVFSNAMADAELADSQAERWPTLQWRETISRGNNPVYVFGSLLEQNEFTAGNFALDTLNAPDPLTNIRSGLKLSLPLFQQNQIRQNIIKAELSREQAHWQLDWMKQHIRLQVLSAYFAVQLALAKEKVSMLQLEAVKSDLDQIRSRFDTGLVVQSDLLAAEVQQSEFQQSQVVAHSQVISAWARLNILLDMPVETRHDLSDRLRRPPEKEADSPIDMALNQRPDYRHLQNECLKQQAELRKSRGAYLPEVAAFADAGISSPDMSTGNSDYMVGISMTWDIWNQSRRPRLDKATAAVMAAEAEKDNKRNEIRLEVIVAEQQVIAARDRLTLVETAVSSADETLRRIQDRYQQGLTTITELLRAQAAAMQVKTNRVETEYRYIIARAQLLLATGALTDVAALVEERKPL